MKQGRFASGVRLLAGADATRALIADERPPVEQADIDRDLAAARSQLKATTFGLLQAEGRVMGLAQALVWA